MIETAAISGTPQPTSSAKSAAGRDAPAPDTVAGLVRTMFMRGSPRILIALVVASAALRLSAPVWGWEDAAVLLAIAAFWPFQEWLIHTFLLHWRPHAIGPFTIDFAQARKHRRHHRDPWNFDDISIPLHTYTYAVPALIAIAYLGRELPWVWTGVLVYVSFGLHYEWCHFMAHSNYVPKTSFYRAVWKNHRLHHFKNEGLWMGVSTQLGDQVLGTCPDQRTVPRSETCKTLGIEEPTTG